MGRLFWEEMDDFDFAATTINADWRSETSLSLDGGNSLTLDSGKRLIRNYDRDNSITKVHDWTTQNARRALGLKVKYSGHHATQLFSTFDATRTRSRDAKEQMKYTQKLRVKRAIRMITHP